MYRSGSTLCYNITKTIIEKGRYGYSLAYPSVEDIEKKEMVVCKCHDIDEKWGVRDERYWKNFTCIYSYRDIRDALVSFCQWRQMTLENFDFQGLSAAEMINWLLEMDEKWRSEENLLLLRYEDYVPYDGSKIQEITARITTFLNLIISQETLESIKTNFNFKSMKDIADSLVEGDKNTLLNPKHLSDGLTNKYKTYFTADEQNRYFLSNSRLTKWLADCRYEI